MSQNHLEAVLVLVRWRSGQDLERDHPEGVDVGGLVGHPVRARLLRSHVAGRSDHETGPRQVFLPSGRSRDPEIRQERVSLPIDHHVGRLEIPVHDSLPVRVVERPGQLTKDVEKLVPRHAALLLHLLQRATLEISHDDVGRVVLPVEIVDRKKVGVLESCDETGLALESLPERAVVEDVRVDDLDGHVPIHAGLIGSEYRGHSARPDLFGYFVGAQLLPDHRAGFPFN